MQKRGDMMKHWRLVSRMAKSTDTDLVGAFKESRLTPDAWANMVTACQGCTWAEDCDTWLDEHQHVCRAPHTCPNRARFTALRSAQDAKAS